MDSKEKLRELFLDPDLLWLTERLRARMRQGKELTGTVTLNDASAPQRQAVDNLLGRSSSRERTITLSLAALGAQLQSAGLANDLGDIVDACFGKVINEREVRDSKELAWNNLFDRGCERLWKDPAGLDWLKSMEADGLLKRFASGDPEIGASMLDEALTIWERLPVAAMTLAEFAAEHTGDTHALDRGQPLSPILLRGLRFRTGHNGNTNAEERRRAWERMGVVVDRLSSPVLTFNLQARADSNLGKILALHRESAQPAYITYQHLQEHQAFQTLPRIEDVYVVENPAIVESASSLLGSQCRPLICTEGIPASAAKLLLRKLSSAGCRLHLRADFDWTGLRIVDQLLTIPNTIPWKMDAATYRSIAANVPLIGKEFDAPWCAELADALKEVGKAAYEEQALITLLEDLRL